MPRYSHAVTVPFAGAITTTIESDDPEPDPDTIADAAAEMVVSLKVEGDAEILEWSMHGRIVQGNLCFVQHTTAIIDDTEDWEEDEEDG